MYRDDRMVELLKQMHLVLNCRGALVDGRQCCWRGGSMGDMCEGS